MKIGVDFDNTIVRYDEIFFRAALDNALIPELFPRNKTKIRDYIRVTKGDQFWSRLQGEVYGSRMDEADLYEGFEGFLKGCEAENHQVYVVSHKSKFSVLGEQFDLHEAASKFVRDKIGVFSPSITDIGRVYFEPTREEKVKRVVEIGCEIFIDDLIEVFLEPSFPKMHRKVLFDPDANHVGSDLPKDLVRASSWREIASLISGKKGSF